ncbi:hypothetical protein [Stenotrophomonas sp. 24(2023)]|uniref:hypothetical protein n=1 Tax=Stenotrophomonas sp. 24(2023) TaxID=3068324 RepID=UPI0027DFB339|nr:hypothetical protein [Stenotrophomonas sp. 24(2023)]WMJ70787.1 hypothetical protein Q9R17_06720 [Stenotrophomonas sp. 24(2023)]
MKTLPVAGLLLLSLAACSRSGETSAPADPATRAEPTAAAPAAPATVAAQGPARLDGFGPLALGSGVDQVRSSWGKPLQGEVPDEGCHYLHPQGDAPEGPWLMIEGNKLVRYDVRGPGVTAPGGGKVGMTLGELQTLYPDRGDVGPDKYDDKVQHLRVRPAQEGGAVIDFTVGAEGKVQAWRVGQTPQVDYVEGCG